MEEEILKLLENEKEITWQTLLYNIIQQQNMDIWDINVSKITKLYIRSVKKLKELDLNLSGKVILAAALLLKMKSTRLVGDDIQDLDNMFSSIQESEVEEIEEFEDFYQGLSLAVGENRINQQAIPKLMPRTPQPRKRKVSIYDLMDALEKALEVKERRIVRREIESSATITLPKPKFNVVDMMKKVYSKLNNLFSRKEKVVFSELVESNRREDKVYTFIPLLHLANQDESKISLMQNRPFGEIIITPYQDSLANSKTF